MSDSSDEEEQKREEPLPPYEIRSSDMREDWQIKCVRSKYQQFIKGRGFTLIGVIFAHYGHQYVLYLLYHFLKVNS